MLCYKDGQEILIGDEVYFCWHSDKKPVCKVIDLYGLNKDCVVIEPIDGYKPNKDWWRPPESSELCFSCHRDYLFLISRGEDDEVPPLNFKELFE